MEQLVYTLHKKSLALKKVLSIIMISALVLPNVWANGVNLKNGNFYISYTDINVPGGGEPLKLTRTYNSKARKVGWFGFGWGSVFETTLFLAPDGTVLVQEHGTGAETRFVSDVKPDADAATQKILDKIKTKSNMTDDALKTLAAKLKTNAEMRKAYAEFYEVSAEVKQGQKFFSNERGLQEIEKTEDGFKRTFNDGKIEYFKLIQKKWKLVKTEDRNNYSITISYNKDTGLVDNIKDSTAKQIFFEWFPDGKVKSVWGPGNKKAQYKYDEEDNLIETTDVADNKYLITYDKKHNLTRIEYSDKSFQSIEYDTKTNFATKIVRRDKSETKYKYESDPQNPDLHYWTSVIRKDFQGKEITDRYEYEIKVRADGSQYTYRILTIEDGIKTETIYNECCGQPLKITKGDRYTTFEYNDAGLLKKKVRSNGEFIDLEYDMKWKKISKVTKKVGWTTYEYDTQGNLFMVKNSQGKAILMKYFLSGDHKGRIKEMIDDDKKSQQRNELTFEYNPTGKPEVITMKDVGTLKVKYDDYGEIKQEKDAVVSIPANPKISKDDLSLRIQSAFFNLMNIVRVPGVDLSM